MKNYDGYGECDCVISGNEERQRMELVFRLRMLSPRVPVPLAVLVALTTGAALLVALLDLLGRQAFVGEQRPRPIRCVLHCGREGLLNLWTVVWVSDGNIQHSFK